jgi:hypothetical protein
MNTLNLILSDVKSQVSLEELKYWNLDNIDKLTLVSSLNGVSIYNKLTHNLMKHLINVHYTVFPHCCGINIVYQLEIASTVDYDTIFKPWLTWVLKQQPIPMLITLVRLDTSDGPYLHSSYEWFAKFGKVLSHHRNWQLHPDHIIELVMLMPIGDSYTYITKI